jgi:undecaprenyl phosphate-alpha-L-ara4FN deformylase
LPESVPPENVSAERILGLRIDVDTHRGTRKGVPNLLKILRAYDIAASFFFCLGPDNMGRHIFRLLKPDFLKKMLRSSAPNLYGWDIIFKGTILPGPVIGEKCADIIGSAAKDGHEIGLHAWDHYTWQAKILKMGRKPIEESIAKGCESLERITGRKPDSSASPGWICNDDILEIKEKFSFSYNSDTRGSCIFFPVLGENRVGLPQIPVTLPTYDEIIGKNGIDHDNYNETLFSLIKPDQLNVLTIHAEAEGIHCLDLFRAFLKGAKEQNISILPLKSLLAKFPPSEHCRVVQRQLEGREGKVAFQDGPTGNIL